MMYIYCDGGCRPNPGKGAAGFIVTGTKKLEEFHRDVKVYEDTTNNRMELQAVTNALKWFYDSYYDKGVELTIVVDSQYVKLGITEWINKWKANGWKTSKRTDVENKDMWQNLNFLVRTVDRDSKITWQWTKGHSGDEWHNAIDKICSDALTSNVAAQEFIPTFTFEQVTDIALQFHFYAKNNGNDVNGILTGTKEEAFKRWYDLIYLKDKTNV